MKKQILISLLLSTSAPAWCATENHMQEHMMMHQAGKAHCKCYCSDKCGPRDPEVEKGDMPFFDPEFKKCFCQQRDKDNYLKNQCDLKEDESFESCCDQQQ